MLVVSGIVLYAEPVSYEEKSWKSTVYERIRDRLEMYQDDLAELFPGNGSIPFRVSGTLKAL